VATIVKPSLPDRIVSRRLVLRAPQAADAETIFASYATDSDVARYMIWQPHAVLSESRAFIDECMRAWEGSTDRRPYVLALHGDEHTPIGMLEARLHGTALVDIGYVLARAHWGEALMPEAIMALTDELLATPSIFRVQATCDIDNKPSARTLEKSGFVREAVLQRYTVHPNISSEPRACFMYARCR
jgi:[ribosomal protein S5]-alanine N-acetyltransferase